MTEVRAFVEKHRIERRLDDALITFDSFPAPVEYYIEIEATSPSRVHEIANSAQLYNLVPDDRYYGDIVRQAQQHLPPARRSTLLFPESALEFARLSSAR